MVERLISSPRFEIQAAGWAAGISFSKLSGINSEVESKDYTSNNFLGMNILAKQFGRAKPPHVVLERPLTTQGNAQLFAWHELARTGNPLAKSETSLTITDASGSETLISYLLENAWCSKIDITEAQAGGGVVLMRVTLECDSILPV